MTTETILTDDELRHHQGQNLNTIGAIDVQITSCIKAGRAIEQAVLQSPEVQRLRRLAKTLDEKIEAYERYGPICTFESDAMIHASHLYELREAMDGTQ